jgi:hypothetical protein
MTVEQKLRLPFNDNYSVDVQIRIKKAENVYTAYIQGGVGAEHPFLIGIKEEDVRELNSELQESLQKVHSYFDPQSVDQWERDEALSLLAVKGAAAFNRIFPRGESRGLIRRALEQAHGRILQITSDDFLLPWEILYDRDITTRIDIQGFWGMRHIISRFLSQTTRPDDFVGPNFMTRRPRVGMVTCHELTHVVEYEIPALQKLDSNGIIALSMLPKLSPSQATEGLETFKIFLAGHREIVHFACHAYEKKPSRQSLLRVEEAFDITMENFDGYDFQVEQFPLVILNACRTGTMDPARTSNWASKFWAAGARGVLATEFRVPDWFAALFVEQLYKRLLAKRGRKPLGQSLLEARHHFWKQGGNPLGLAYALYSSPNIQFINMESLS